MSSEAERDASAGSSVRRLRPEDAAALVALRQESLELEPYSFGAAIGEDRALSLEYVRGALADEQQAVFGHFEGGTLRGMVGLMRAGSTKRRHRAHVWGTYVAAPARGKGAGRALMRAAIAHARTWPGLEQVTLSVTHLSAAAQSLYETEGFRIWGREPRALAWQGRYVDEIHLTLALREPAA